MSCRKKGCTDSTAINYDAEAKKDDGTCEFDTSSPEAQPYDLNVPAVFAQYLLPPNVPEDNPMTVEGVELGRKLFYDPILSGDGTQACASCHNQAYAFTDNGNQFSTGIDGIEGTITSMPLFNLAWNNYNTFFWDGRAEGIEGQAHDPVVNPIEMHNVWPSAVAALQQSSVYPNLFEAAFGTSTIDSNLVVKAIAQFERTIISGNSKFDRYLLGQEQLTPSELSGFQVFMDEAGGDCFHCHGDATNPLWTDNKFHNNGLDSVFTDNGLGDVTGDPADNGKFKTPSLRNLIYTAPYMHDGRFATLDDVLDHYSTGLHYSSTIDPLMKNVAQGGMQMSPQERIDLKAFLLSLTDESFINNSELSAP